MVDRFKLMFWSWLRKIHDRLHQADRVDVYTTPHQDPENVHYTSPAEMYIPADWRTKGVG